jgi:hypothetical protein
MALFFEPSLSDLKFDTGTDPDPAFDFADRDPAFYSDDRNNVGTKS